MSRADHVDAAFVHEKRRMRAGWGAIAVMTGVSAIDLRRRFEVGFVSETSRRETPREAAQRALRRLGFSEDHALIYGRLWHANGRRIASLDLTRGIAGGANSTFVLREAFKTGAPHGLSVDRQAGVGIALSAEGIAAINLLVDP